MRVSFNKNTFILYGRELVALLVSLIAVLFAVSLYSYNPTDSSWFFITSLTPRVTNWCGWVGAHIAALSCYLFGAAAWLLVFVLLFSAYIILRARPFSYEWERFVGFGVLIWVGAALCRVHALDFWGSPVSGGIAGRMLYTGLYVGMNHVGTIILLYGIFFASAILVIRFSCIRFVQQAVIFNRKLFGEYKVAHKAYAYGKFIVLHMVFKPIAGCAYHIKALLDGSALKETGLLVPKQDEDEQNVFYWDPQSTSQAYAIEHQDEDDSDYMIASPSFNVNDAVVSPTVIDMAQGVSSDRAQIVPKQKINTYSLPSLNIFISTAAEQQDAVIRKELEERAHVLEEKLGRFGVSGKVTEIRRGPVVTVFEYEPEIDTKISKILALEDDLAMALQALSIRILAPIPGRSVVGFEVANKKREDVLFADVVRSVDFTKFKGSLPLVLGQDTVGHNVIVDLAKMPHLLIAGSTGSGKSVALNAMLVSLLCRLKPEELRLVLIDPKRLEFASYADIAHLLFPIVTDPRRAAPVLRWVVKEMEQRYEKMAACGARNIFDYNNCTIHAEHQEKLPFIVVIIDELADLMMTAGRDIEDLITRIAQMARASGIHMIVATQRPSVDVITGLIKVNFPSRISFRVTSKIDSRTILDCVGADKLLGRGDMLFLDAATASLNRIHGAYLSNKEIEDLVRHIHAERTVMYLDLHEQLLKEEDALSQEDGELMQEIMEFLQDIDEVSISLLQRRFRIGYNRSARIIDLLESRGAILPADGSKTRKVVR
ncbi:MAG TPA: DNA translocase FtsK [Candidatus Dependentiae bacterium]|nr:DNA translocase FtsK [Candidatus Dependentiae bacterium]HRQ62528.1 DNA translocase FtsK [Candidatus Dependentiae bacterium]